MCAHACLLTPHGSGTTTMRFMFGRFLSHALYLLGGNGGNGGGGLILCTRTDVTFRCDVSCVRASVFRACALCFFYGRSPVSGHQNYVWYRRESISLAAHIHHPVTGPSSSVSVRIMYVYVRVRTSDHDRGHHHRRRRRRRHM